MLLEIQNKLIPSLSRLKVAFTVVGPHKDIADFVAVEITDRATCLRVVSEEKAALHFIEKCINQRA